MIHEVYPKLKCGAGPVQPEDIEQHAFFHILTEAVATVGLDYWYLSTIQINELIPIGSNQGPLTTSYHQRNRAEFEKINPQLKVQEKNFFELLTKFYCSGVFYGFDLEDLRLSPLTYRWLEKELEYGEIARQYTREWLLHLAGVDHNLSLEELSAPIQIHSKWQKNLIHEVGTFLWQMIKENAEINPAPLKQSGFSSAPRAKKKFPAPTLFNINSLGLDFWSPLLKAHLPLDYRKNIFSQIVSKYRLADISDLLSAELQKQREDPDFKIMRRLLKDHQPLELTSPEPADLFFAG